MVMKLLVREGMPAKCKDVRTVKAGEGKVIARAAQKCSLFSNWPKSFSKEIKDGRNQKAALTSSSFYYSCCTLFLVGQKLASSEN